MKETDWNLRRKNQMNGKAMQICMFVKYSFEKYKGTTPFFVKLKKRRILDMGFAGLMEPSQHIL